MALWPILATSLPLVYLTLYDTNYLVTGLGPFDYYGIYLLAVPSLLATFCLLTGTSLGIWVSRFLMLLNVTFLKLLLIELNKDTDYVLKLHDFQIRRIWSDEELYEKAASTISFYNIKVNPTIAIQMVSESQGSIIKVKELAVAHANKVLNPTVWEKIISFTYLNLPTIITTAVVSLAVGGVYIGIKKWLFPPKSLDATIETLEKTAQRVEKQQHILESQQEIVNNNVREAVAALNHNIHEVAEKHGASLNTLDTRLTENAAINAQTLDALDGTAADLERVGKTVHDHATTLASMAKRAPQNNPAIPTPVDISDTLSF